MNKVKQLLNSSDFWLQTAFLVSTAAVLGSLFLSQAMNLLPCELCWWQRVFMFPLPIILGVALWRKDFSVYYYGLPLVVIGLFIAAYHYSIQMIPQVADTCGASALSCIERQIDILGFITIPLGSLLAFLVVGFCLVMLKKTATRA